jgi:flagellin
MQTLVGHGLLHGSKLFRKHPKNLIKFKEELIMRINNNLMAMNTHRQMGSTGMSQAKSMEKLSSGYRINRAGDDAAGLAISEKMRGQIRGLSQASRNAQDGISMIQTAEGALTETHDIVQRMRELAVQATNDTMSTDDRNAIGAELFELTKEIGRIADTTKFNGKGLLNGTLLGSNDGAGTTNNIGAALATNAVVTDLDVSGAAAGTYTLAAAADSTDVTLTDANGISQTVTIAAATTGGQQSLNFSQFGITYDLTGIGAATATNIATALNGDSVVVTGTGSATFGIGANAGETVQVTFGDMRASALGSGGGDDIADRITGATAANAYVDSSANAQALITLLDDALVDVSTQRATLGANQNRLEHTIKNLDTSAENLQAAESRIRDVDMAKEMMAFTKNNILQQAAQSMLAQANQAPQGVLQLLR